MAIKDFVSKLSLFCEAGSTPGFEGYSANFHNAAHGFTNMEVGAEKVLSQTPENTRKIDGHNF